MLKQELLTIASIDFDSLFQNMNSARCLELFKHGKNLNNIAHAIAWPNSHKAFNIRSPLSSLYVACIILWRLGTPAPWREAREIFGRFESDLSRIFWDGIENFLLLRGDLLDASLLWCGALGNSTDNLEAKYRVIHVSESGES